MEKLLFVMASLLLTVSTTVQAQGKADQVKRIRQLYAQAKQQVENNGKNGANPLDMVIHVSNPELVSEDFELDDETLKSAAGGETCWSLKCHKHKKPCTRFCSIAEA